MQALFGEEISRVSTSRLFEDLAANSSHGALAARAVEMPGTGLGFIQDSGISVSIAAAARPPGNRNSSPSQDERQPSEHWPTTGWSPAC